MGAFIYRETVSNRIVELENECEREKRKEFLGTLGCIGVVAIGMIGLLFRISVL